MSFFGTISTNCSGCKNLGNRNTDTVSVDASKIQEVSRVAAAPGKENSNPKQEEDEMRRQRAAEAVKKMREEKEAEERRRRQQQEEEEQQRQQREEEMQRQKAEEEAEEQRRAIEAEEARIAAEREQAEQRRFEAEEQERLRRQREEEEEEEGYRRLREEAEAKRLKEEEDAKRDQLNAFLQKAGFQEATEKKVKKGLISSSFSYPLHAAVKAKDAEAVELLLWAGADPTLQNSKKQTPLELAQKKNDKKTQSHAKVMAALAA